MITLSLSLQEANHTYPILIEWDEISTTRSKILSQMNGKKFLVVISDKVDKTGNYSIL